MRRGFGENGLWLGIDTKMKADGLKRAGGGGTHEAVVADSGEAFGQDVEEPAADQLVGAEDEDAGFAGLTAGPVEADIVVFVIADDAVGTDGAAFDVAGQIADGGFAAPDVLELDVPCFAGL